MFHGKHKKDLTFIILYWWRHRIPPGGFGSPKKTTQVLPAEHWEKYLMNFKLKNTAFLEEFTQKFKNTIFRL